MKYVITHAGCYDGFGAAFAFWKYFGDREPDVQYIKAQYSDSFPLLEPNSEVFIADFCYSPEIITNAAKTLKSITILDHHKTSYEKYIIDGISVKLPENVYIEFDMNRSGALMAWNHLFPDKKVPLLIEHISDRDLWRFRLDNTEKVHVALKSYPMDFKIWDQFLEQDAYADLVHEGETLMRYEKQMVGSICKNARMEIIGGYEVPVVASSVAPSEVCNKLLELYPKAKFAACYMDRPEGYRNYSLRSRKDFDCSEVAKKFDGGGHAQASGFKVDIPKDEVTRSD